METKHLIAYAALIVASSMVGQFAIELGAGAVPIPTGWEWLVPIILAGLQALGAFLPRPGQMDVTRVTTTVEKPAEEHPTAN